MGKIIRIRRNVYFAQSKGDWLFLQIGYTAIHFCKLWGDKHSSKGCLRVELFAPKNKPTGYSRTKFKIQKC